MNAPPVEGLRDARPGDLADIVAIYNSTIASRIVTADTEPVSVASREGWFADHGPASRPLWVLERGDRMAAWLSFSSFYGRPAYRHTAEVSIYVHADARRRGIATQLLRAAIAAAPDLQITTLLGFIFGHNAPSLALFERHGFVNWAHLPRVAVLDGVERDLIIVGLRV